MEVVQTDNKTSDSDCEDSNVLESSNNTSPEAIQQLSNGFLAHFLPDAEKSKASLDELVNNQNILLETVQHENQKFTECQAAKDMDNLMVKTKYYYNKLLSLKKEMSSLHERANRLKRSSVRLQQQKQREALQLEQKKEAELEREKQLVAKPTKHAGAKQT